MSPEQQRFIAPKDKILYHPDLILDVLNNNSRIPRHFELDLTYRCNLACDGCHFAYTHTNANDFSGDMPVELFSKIASDMSANQVKAVTFTGGGEPLFHPKHLEIFQIAKKAGLDLGMYTNGVFLQGTTAEFVAENFTWCYISLDATNPKEYFEYKRRGRKVFERNIANIKSIAERKGRKANIGVGYLVNQYNLHTLKESVAWLLTLGTDMVQLRPLIDVGSYAEQRQSSQMKGMGFETDEKIWKKHYAWVEKALEIIDTMEGTPCLETSRKKFTDLLKGKRDYKVCLSTSLSSAIGPHGEVWQCVNRREITKLGDLNTQNLFEIFSKKPIEFCDLKFCRLMCRNDQLNQSLVSIIDNPNNSQKPDANISHINFI